MISGMNHFTVLTDDLERTLAFYVDVLGLRAGWRPQLGFPGAWLYAGEQAVLHIVAGRPLPAQRAGVIDHVAFSASGLARIKASLDQAQVPYEVRQQRDSKVWQLFCHDPNGAKVELDFEPDESE
jgi:catechol 2,3-dioxygenase-like lactoylglutathione lyase family enzyme